MYLNIWIKLCCAIGSAVLLVIYFSKNYETLHVVEQGGLLVLYFGHCLIAVVWAQWFILECSAIVNVYLSANMIFHNFLFVCR